MIYSLEERAQLNPLGRLTERSQGLSDRLKVRGIIGCFYLVAAPIFLVVWVVGLLFGSKEDEDSDVQEPEVEGWSVFSEEGLQIACKRDECGEFTLRMNTPAFRAFVASLTAIYPIDEGDFEGPCMGTLKGQVAVEKTGYHAHSEFFFPQLPVELTVGTAPGQVEVHGGETLYASKESWNEVLSAWSALAEKGHEALIVLDRWQEAWCTPASEGRFVLELRPFFNVRDLQIR